MSPVAVRGMRTKSEADNKICSHNNKSKEDTFDEHDPKETAVVRRDHRDRDGVARDAQLCSRQAQARPVARSQCSFVALRKRASSPSEGIEVETVFFRSGAELVPALSTGQIDVAMTSPGAALYNAMAQGVNATIVASYSVADPRPRRAATRTRSRCARTCSTAARSKAPRTSRA